MLQEPFVLRSFTEAASPLAMDVVNGSDPRSELKLIRKLHRLSRVSWSPTLRANAEALKARETELRRSTASKKKGK